MDVKQRVLSVDHVTSKAITAAKQKKKLTTHNLKPLRPLMRRETFDKTDYLPGADVDMNDVSKFGKGLPAHLLVSKREASKRLEAVEKILNESAETDE